MSLRLIIEDDEGTTTVVPLGQEAITIGRQQGNTIQLTEKNVSRRHARLFPEQQAWIIEDLGSYNGVKVNAQKVEGRIVLQEGDVIQIGDYHLALTENADKRTLNYDQPAQAANDVEPLLVSSSTDLPRLSPEELAQLSSEPHMPQPGVPAMPEPSPVAPAYPQPEARKGGAGVLLAVGLVVIGGLALGGFWLANRDDAPPQRQAVDTPEKPVPKKPEPAPAQEPGAVAQADGPDEIPEPIEPAGAGQASGDTAAVAIPEGDDGGPTASDEAGTPPPPVEVEPEPEPEPKPSQPSRTKRRPRKRSASKPRPDPVEAPPEAPPAPPVDAAALLADARKASLGGRQSKAFELAKKAYKAKPSQDAASLMATAACKMGDAGKANYAIAKLSGKKKQDAQKLCEIKGVQL